MNDKGGKQGDPTALVFRTLGDLTLLHQMERGEPKEDNPPCVLIHVLRRQVADQKEARGTVFSIDRCLEELQFLGLIEISADARGTAITPYGLSLALALRKGC